MTQQPIKTITCHEVYALSLKQPIELIDVRTPEEFQQARAAIARNVPLDNLDPHELIQSRERPADEPLYLICQMGGRSGHACAMLMEAGYPNVFNVVGGTEAWLEIGLPSECQM